LERREEILERQKIAVERASARKENRPVLEVLADALDEEDDSLQCTVCAI
jgi:hypothetical protein